MDLNNIGDTQKKSGFVYCLLDTENNVCKIGMSTSEKNRTSALMSSHPFKLLPEVVAVEDRLEAENYLHRLFCKKRKGGEWFNGVTHEEFLTVIYEYNFKKEQQPLDSLSFYKFLYDTEYEFLRGIPIKCWDNLRKRRLNIFVYVDDTFADKYYFREKMDSILKNVIDGSIITFATDYKGINDLCADYKRYKKNDYIGIHTFFANYNYKTSQYNDTILTNSYNAIMCCFGVVVFCTKESFVTKSLIDFANKNNRNSRLLVKPKAINTLPKKY